MPNRKVGRRRVDGERAGSALVIAMVLVTGLVFMTFAYFQISASAEKRVNGDLNDERAFFLAEAGLNEAIEALRAGESGAIGEMVWDDPTQTWTTTDPVYLGGGILWVESAPAGTERTRLTATSMAGAGRYSITAVVETKPQQDPLFVATLNSDKEMPLNQGVVIDSFDSSLGSYASQATNSETPYTTPFTLANLNGDVRSNEGIVLNESSTVFGDVTPGPGYGVTFNKESYVSGSTSPAIQPFKFNPVPIPSYPEQGAYTVGSAPQTLAAGDYYFNQGMTIGKEATLTIQGPANIVVSDFTGGKDANLLIDATNGPVTFFVENTYTHTAGFEANAVKGSEMALAFLIQGTQDVVFPSQTDIRGAYYAPNSSILFSNANECWGAFAASKIEMSNDMRFHFDETLLRHWGGNNEGRGPDVKLLAWNEAPVYPHILREDRRDPMTIFGLRKKGLPSPYTWWWNKAQAASQTTK